MERPKFEIIAPGELDGNWSVKAIWPDGQARRIRGFTSQEVVAEWLAKASDAWLRKARKPKRDDKRKLLKRPASPIQHSAASMGGGEDVAVKAGPKKRKGGHGGLWTEEENRELKAHSKSKAAVAEISRAMNRTSAAVRQQAAKLGIPLGHRR